jgi:LemA protein
MTPPGWYADPTRPTGDLLRWWDGTNWTDHTCANPAIVPQPQPAATPRWVSTKTDDLIKAHARFAAGPDEPGPDDFVDRYTSEAGAAAAPAKAQTVYVPVLSILALFASIPLAALVDSTAIGLAAAAVAVGAGLIKRWQIVDTPAVPIASVYPGVCEVVGTARTPEGVTVRALGTGTECCWWSAEYHRHDPDGHDVVLWRVESGEVPFELWDSNDDAAVLVESPLASLAVTTLNTKPSKNRLFIEKAVPIGTTVYAQGPVQFYDGRPTMTTRRPPDAPATRTTGVILARGNEAETRAASLRGLWILATLFGLWIVAAVWQATVSPQTLPISLLVLEVLALFVGGAALSCVRLRNRLVEVKWRITEAAALISTFAQRRHDLIGQLAATANAAAAHENQILVSAATAGTPEQVIDGDAQTRAQVVARAEASPQLKADAAFANLFHELVRCEDQIAGARTHYNNAIQVAEAHAEQFPTSLLAPSVLGEIPPRFSGDSIGDTSGAPSHFGSALR